MKHWQMRRPLAVLLLLATMLTAALPFTVSAETADGTNGTEETYGGRTMEEILDLISGSTYDDYTSKNLGNQPASISRKDPIEVDGDDIVIDSEKTTASYETGDAEYFGIDKMPEKDSYGNKLENVNMVYTPSTGKVTFTVNIPEDGMYAIDMLYYPIVSLP